MNNTIKETNWGAISVAFADMCSSAAAIAGNIGTILCSLAPGKVYLLKDLIISVLKSNNRFLFQ